MLFTFAVGSSTIPRHVLQNSQICDTLTMLSENKNLTFSLGSETMRVQSPEFNVNNRNYNLKIYLYFYTWKNVAVSEIDKQIKWTLVTLNPTVATCNTKVETFSIEDDFEEDFGIFRVRKLSAARHTSYRPDAGRASRTRFLAKAVFTTMRLQRFVLNNSLTFFWTEKTWPSPGKLVP